MTRQIEEFVQSFKRAIGREMDAMRERLGPFEVPLDHGHAIPDASTDRAKAYRFDIMTPNDKLVLHAECTLRCEDVEHLVTIVGLDAKTVTIVCDRGLQLNQGSYALVLYPWFLYERLILALESLLDADEQALRHAFAAFGKAEPVFRPCTLRADHVGLNESQMLAIQLCCDSSLAFIWGPPGTGKTTTLGHIVTELVKQGQRVLVTSTTNAAVDQALAKLALMPGTQHALTSGQVVRIGQSQGDTYGTSVGEVAARLGGEARERIERLTERLREARAQFTHCERILGKLAADADAVQSDFFLETAVDPLMLHDLTPVFTEMRARRILGKELDMRSEIVARRKARLEAVCGLCETGIREAAAQLRDSEVAIVRKAKLVLATMTNVYINRLLQNERFDAVIVEEAGMAILPTLFYCASLANGKAILVGDPKQLPPIVQSRDPLVYRAMGRNVFEVTVPQPHDCDVVVMLDTQYRMHPVIGRLVSTLFYDGKLRDAACTADREAIAAKAPFPGHPLVVVDTAGQASCATRDGGFSRFNETTAELSVRLALEAVDSGIKSVAIITPYAEQSRLIRKLLQNAGRGARQIECQTVHRFQGNERDMVLLDTVDTAPYRPGVLLADVSPRSSARNLLNVSISRARGKLAIIADADYFHTYAPNGAITEVLARALQGGSCVAVDGRPKCPASGT